MPFGSWHLYFELEKKPVVTTQNKQQLYGQWEELTTSCYFHDCDLFQVGKYWSIKIHQALPYKCEHSSTYHLKVAILLYKYLI